MSISSANSSFNDNPHVRESHNCYSYFLNLKSKSAYKLCKKNFAKQNICRRSQPGYASNYPSLQTEDFNCPTIMKRTLDDNKTIFQVTKDFQCGPEYYKGALVVAPKRDYHYYRLNKEKIWSHKPGYKPSTIYDAKGKIITDPELADRNYGGTRESDVRHSPGYGYSLINSIHSSTLFYSLINSKVERGNRMRATARLWLFTH